MIAASMAGAGQLVAGDPVHLVALVLDGHGGTGELVLGPDRAGGHGTRTSRDLDAREGGLLLPRVRPRGNPKRPHGEGMLGYLCLSLYLLKFKTNKSDYFRGQSPSRCV